MTETSAPAERVAFVGLGSMGAPMAVRLVEAGLAVTGYDIVDDLMASFRRAGGRTSASPAEAAAGAQLLIVMVLNAEQAEEVLFGADGAVDALSAGATVMVSSTVSPDFAREVELRLRDRGMELLDAPVSGGVARAEDGTLTIMASGSAAAFAASEKALAAMSDKVYRLGETAGTGSTVKMVNQLLAGVHIAAAAEAMALGVRAGLDPHVLFEVISVSAGSSWMFNNRVPRMVEGDYRTRSALDIFVKDLGIVLDFGRRADFPLPLTASALQMYLMGTAAGLGRQDDAGLVRVFERMAGVRVSATEAHVSGEP